MNYQRDISQTGLSRCVNGRHRPETLNGTLYEIARPWVRQMGVGTQLTSADFIGRLLVHPSAPGSGIVKVAASCGVGPASFIRRVRLAAGFVRVQVGDHIQKTIEDQVHSYVAGMVRRLKNCWYYEKPDPDISQSANAHTDITYCGAACET